MNLRPRPGDWIWTFAGITPWYQTPIICERCGDDDTGPWLALDETRLLCEACWEKRTT